MYKRNILKDYDILLLVQKYEYNFLNKEFQKIIFRKFYWIEWDEVHAFDYRWKFVKSEEFRNKFITLRQIHFILVRRLSKLFKKWLIKKYSFWMNALEYWEFTRSKKCISYYTDLTIDQINNKF